MSIDYNMQQDVKIAVTAAPWALNGAPVLLCGEMHSQFKKAKAMGYDAIELHLRTPNDAAAYEILSLSNECSINVSSVATGLLNLVDKLSFIDDDKEIRSKAVVRVKEFIDWSAVLQCGVILGSLRESIPDIIHNKEKHTGRLTECIEEILKYAESAKVPIYLEVINRYETNYLNTAKETLDFVRGFNSELLFVHLDTFHMNIEENNIENAIEMCGSKLGYIHFADNNRHACGNGMINFKNILKALQKIEYRGYISVECLPIPDGISAASQSMEYIKKLIG